jgi:hypothetical protein
MQLTENKKRIGESGLQACPPFFNNLQTKNATQTISNLTQLRNGLFVSGLKRTRLIRVNFSF